MTPSLNLPAVLVVALGGAIGSVARYVAGMLLLPVSSGFPVGTLVVNVLGRSLLAPLQGWPSPQKEIICSDWRS